MSLVWKLLRQHVSVPQFVGFFFARNDKANVILPTRPKYINKMMINFEKTLRLLVMPIDIPTVPTAEITSNATANDGRF